MRILLVLVALAHADNSIPSPAPAASWRQRCEGALKEAREQAAREDPGFGRGVIALVDKSIRFDAYIADREHGRFYGGKPAHYFIEVVEKKSKAPGELGADVMSPKDPQASAGKSKWTRERYADMDVQIAEYKKVEIFNRLFRPAMDRCLQ